MVNYFQAHKLLDEVKDGHNHTTANISTALELTGDIIEFGLVGEINSGVCGTGLGGWRSSPKGWQENLLDTPI